ncbi:MAG: hypothetical protein P1R58_12680 [bacterium]|nr:hypothetical protein [bacterium]
MNNIEEVLIPIVVFSTIYFVAKLLSDNRIRSKLIDKGEINENLRYLFAVQTGKAKVYSNLKWGFVLLGIGVAMLLKQIAPFYITDESVFGLMFIFAGVGFLVYYFISKDQFTNGDQRPPTV